MVSKFKQKLNNPNSYDACRNLLSPATSSLAQTRCLNGEEKEAQAEGQPILKINPQFSISRYASTQPFKNPSDLERNSAGLRQAGLQG